MTSAINAIDHESAQQRIWLLLRIGVAGCFIGHGCWGLITKAGWLPLFEVFFIGESAGYQLMPLIGTFDILVGLICLIYPNRAVIFWAAFWTIFTAVLRPSAGMGMSEFFERAGNFGIPLAMVLIAGIPSTFRELFTRVDFKKIADRATIFRLEWIMRLTVFSLLVGHGGLAVFMNSPLLHKHLSHIGVLPSGNGLMVFGMAEILLGFVVLIWPRIPGLMIFIVLYKLATELLHPIAGRPIDFLETIERMGDYIAPLVLFTMYRSGLIPAKSDAVEKIPLTSA